MSNMFWDRVKKKFEERYNQNSSSEIENNKVSDTLFSHKKEELTPREKLLCFTLKKNKHLSGDEKIAFDKIYDTIIYMQKFLKDPVVFGLSQVDKNLLDNIDKRIEILTYFHNAAHIRTKSTAYLYQVLKFLTAILEEVNEYSDDAYIDIFTVKKYTTCLVPKWFPLHDLLLEVVEVYKKLYFESKEYENYEESIDGIPNIYYRSGIDEDFIHNRNILNIDDDNIEKWVMDFKIEKNKYLVGEYGVLYDKLYEAVIFLQNYLKDPVEFGLANIDKRFLDEHRREILIHLHHDKNNEDDATLYYLLKFLILLIISINEYSSKIFITVKGLEDIYDDLPEYLPVYNMIQDISKMYVNLYKDVFTGELEHNEYEWIFEDESELEYIYLNSYDNIEDDIESDNDDDNENYDDEYEDDDDYDEDDEYNEAYESRRIIEEAKHDAMSSYIQEKMAEIQANPLNAEKINREIMEKMGSLGFIDADMHADITKLQRVKANAYMNLFQLDYEDFFKLTKHELISYNNKAEKILDNMINILLYEEHIISNEYETNIKIDEETITLTRTREFLSLLIDEYSNIKIVMLTPYYFSDNNEKVIGFASDNIGKKDGVFEVFNFRDIIYSLMIVDSVDAKFINKFDITIKLYYALLFGAYSMNNRNYYAADKEYLSDEEIEEVISKRNIYSLYNMVNLALISSVYTHGDNRITSLESIELDAKKALLSCKEPVCEIFIVEECDDEVNVLAYKSCVYKNDNKWITNNIKEMIDSIMQGNRMIEL